MDYQVSARKYRPSTFADVIGQPHIVQTLVNAITTRRIAHAFLFSGTRGVGKTTVARILAKALNCEHGPTGTPCDTCPNCLEIAQGTSVDVIEIDGASNTGVDDVREIRENVKFTPFRGGYRVYIIDEVHMLSNSAFNALLKTLEEPPAHVVFIFATTEIHKIPSTILSRCQHYNFRRIATSEITSRLRHVAQQDHLTIEDRSLAVIARAGEGSLRDALSLLDQAVAFGGKTIRHLDVVALLGTVPLEQVRALMAAIIAQDSPAALRAIAQSLDSGHDVRAYCAELVEYVRNLLVASVMAPSAVSDTQRFRDLIDLGEEDLLDIAHDAGLLTTEVLQDMFRIFCQAEDSVRLSPRPRFVLEAAAVRAARFKSGESRTSEESQRMHEAKSRPEPRKTATASRAESPPAGGPPQSAPTTVEEIRPVKTAAVAKLSAHHDATPHQITQRRSAQTAPASPSPAVAEPASATNASMISTTRLADVALPWEAVVEELERRHPNIGPFLARGTVVGIEGNHVTVGYPKSASVALARIQKEDTLQLVNGVCSELAGQPVRLRIVELADGQEAPPNLTQVRAAKIRSAKELLLEQTRAHPFVKHALELFGGEVVEVRPISPQEEAR